MLRRLASLPLVLGAAACAPPPPGPPVLAAETDAATDAGRDVGVAHAADPLLTELAVSAAAAVDGAAPVTLVPPFSPDIHDYYVRCAAGPNDLTIAMTAKSGSSAELLSPTTTPARPTQTVSIVANENQAIVAAATSLSTTVTYWVRCLPHDFPALRMIAHPDAGTPTPGYYLVGDFLPRPNRGSYAMVLDVHGVPVWYLRGAPGGMGDVDQLASGTLSFIAFSAKTPVFEIVTLAPESSTYAAPSGVLLDGHELRPAAGGRYVVISNPVTTGFDLSGIRVPVPDGGTRSFGPGSSIQDCNVVEFEGTTGAVTWQWIGSEHLDPVKDTTVPALGTFDASAPDGGAVVDPFHCNSLDVDPANGNLLVSARNADSIFYVDRATGAILWKMGGAAYTKDGAARVTTSDPFYRQHDARLLPGWSSTCAGGRGQISVFDDESERPAPARGVIYDVIVGAADGGASGCADGGVPGTGTVAWQYVGTASSLVVGSFRVSADGSRVIGWGQGASNRVFTEVDVHGADLLDFEFTDGDTSYRAVKVPVGALDLGAMRATASRQ